MKKISLKAACDSGVNLAPFSFSGASSRIEKSKPGTMVSCAGCGSSPVAVAARIAAPRNIDDRKSRNRSMVNLTYDGVMRRINQKSAA
jgi:hypothetical protein